MINRKRYRRWAIILVGLLIVPSAMLLPLLLAEPNYVFRLDDLIGGNTRLRFRHGELSAEPRLSPVRQLVGDGRVCDAFIVKGTYDHFIAAAVQTSDHCQLLVDNLAANQLETFDSDGDQDFDFDLQCGRGSAQSGRAFVGQILLNRQKYGVKGRFDEPSGWVFLLIQRQ